MNVFFDGTLKKCDIYKAHLELAINGFGFLRKSLAKSAFKEKAFQKG
jgi:hypothetical protein